MSIRPLRIRLGSWVSGITCACALMVAMPVWADKASSRQLQVPQATLQADASQVVPQDTVKIYLLSEITGTDRQEIDRALAQTMAEATKRAKGHPGIKLATHNYSVWPFTDKENAIAGWRGRGELVLESADFEATSKLAASLGDLMSIGRLSFGLSPEARARHTKDLLVEAVKQFRQHASSLATALGYESYAIREINLDDGGAHYPAPRMMAMAADQASVPLEAGEESVSVSISGSIYLLSSTEQRRPKSSE